MSSPDISAGVNSESAAMRSQRHSTSPCIWRRCTSIPNATNATKDSWGRVNSPGTLPSLLRHFYSSACAFVLNRYINNIATSPQGFLFYFISDAGCTGTVAPPPPPHVTQIVTVRRRWKDGRQRVASLSHKSKQFPLPHKASVCLLASLTKHSSEARRIDRRVVQHAPWNRRIIIQRKGGGRHGK